MHHTPRFTQHTTHTHSRTPHPTRSTDPTHLTHLTHLTKLQAVKEQLGSTVALTAAPAHGSVGSASAVGAPVRTAGPARGGQLGAAAAATRSAAPGLLHELQQAQGAPQVGQQQPSEATSEDLIRAALDDVGLEGTLASRTLTLTLTLIHISPVYLPYISRASWPAEPSPSPSPYFYSYS